jgi:Mce-associated membrane protein
VTGRRLPIALGALAVLLAGLAVWAGLAARGATDEAGRLRAESDRLAASASQLTEGLDLDNAAVTDAAGTAEVDQAVRQILEQVLSYDHRDLERTARAVAEHVTGQALCAYNGLYGEVRRLAAEQRITLTSEVREIGVTRLQADRADVLVFVDQSTTRGDGAPGPASAAQFGVAAQRLDGQWRIVEFDLLDQPLSDGQEVPRC